jgi:carboxyl-terminal processing protease
MNKKISLGATIMLMAMTAAVAITITIVIVMRILNSDITDFSQRAAMFKKLSNVDATVRDNYIGKINDATLNDEIIQGYMKGIGDKYGTYFDADEYNKISLSNEGKATGIGVNVVENTDGYIKVVSVLAGSPADKSGVAVNDLITTVEGKDVKSLGFTSAVNLLKGNVGTTSTFTVVRSSIYKQFSIVRKTYDTQTVQSRMIGTLGYVRIIEFDSNTSTQFSAQVDNLISRGAKGIVFDVRNDPGGLLDSVEKMIDKVVPAGPIVRAKYKNGKITTLATSDVNQVNLPMAVLTNQNTASAAELFTAALKDYGKAKSIGTKTYGKGTMQQVINLNDGTALDLSVALFYPPKSDNFEGIGVVPDISVTLSQDKQNNFYSLADSDDDQLQAGIKYITSLIQ